jgi:hypothetical protein
MLSKVRELWVRIVQEIALLKGWAMSHEMNIFVRVKYTYCPCAAGFKFLGCLVKEQKRLKILLALSKPLQILRTFWKSHHNVTGRFSPESTPHWMKRFYT